MSIEDIGKIQLETNLKSIKHGSPFIALTRSFIDVDMLDKYFVGKPCFYVHENNRDLIHDNRLTSENFRITTINKAAGAIFFPIKEEKLKSRIVKYNNVQEYGFKFMIYSNTYTFKFMPDYTIGELSEKVGIVLSNKKNDNTSKILFDRVYRISHYHVVPI